MSDDLILPTDEQVERAARLMCAADGHDPDSNTQEMPGYDPLDAGHYVSIAQFSGPNWKQYKQSARKHLILLLNKDRILGEHQEPDVWKCSCGHGNWKEKDRCNNCGTRKEEADALQAQAPRQAETKAET